MKQRRLRRPDLPVVHTGRGFDLLSGVKVLDLTTSVAGPYGSMLLADMGAEVIKVERPGTGDDARSWGPPFLGNESLWFISMNRNKKSLTLDYSKDAGLETLNDLVRIVDVVMVNMSPAVTAKLRIDEKALRTVKPDLIYVSITGFGMRGKRANWTCYDLIAEGYSGIMDLTGTADSDPQKIGAPAADMLAGQDAAFATLAAIVARQRTGAGRLIDISLVESMTRFLACRITPYLGSGETPRRSGGKDSVIAVYHTFETADFQMTLGLGNDNIWRRFWDAVGEPAVGDDPKYRSNADRRNSRAEIVDRIQALLAMRPRAHWLEILCAARVPAGPVNRIDEVVTDAELQQRGLFFQLVDGEAEHPQVGLGIHIDGEATFPRSAAPRLGQHTTEIVSDLLSYSAEKTHTLKEMGVI